MQHVAIKIEYWKKNSLPPLLCEKGLAFIRRRFCETWKIHRIDVTYYVILRRENVILFDNSKIVGWLGIEDDGELTNACIEKHYKGSDLLLRTINTAYEESSLDYMYARVPIEKLGSAKVFLKSGMKLNSNPDFIRLIYPERDVVLIRLTIYKKDMTDHKSNVKEIRKDLERLRGIAHAYRNIRIPERIIQKEL
jgi:hypothetical protein